MTLIRILFLIVLQLAAATVYAAPFGSRKVGLELEFLGTGIAADSSKPENFLRLLDYVRAHFGGWPATTHPWSRYSSVPGLVYAATNDIQNRPWSAVPEKLTSDSLLPSGYDGYELVTPPFTSHGDAVAMQNMMRAIEADGLFVKGRNSSTHFTFDVSDLIELDGNIARLVDVMLYLESRMTDIYRFVKPARYDHVINSYAVPLGLDQKNLLKEIAALPRDQRTMSTVRAIFKKFERQEIRNTRGRSQGWKYRAINYKKLFGLLAGTEPIPVLEFRIADLLSADEIETVGAFYTELIEKGSQTEMNAFVDAFPGFDDFIPGTPEHRRLDRYVMDCDAWLK